MCNILTKGALWARGVHAEKSALRMSTGHHAGPASQAQPNIVGNQRLSRAEQFLRKQEHGLSCTAGFKNSEILNLHCSGHAACGIL